MPLTKFPLTDAPTGAAYWRAVLERTSGDAFALPAFTSGSFASSTTFDALNDVGLRLTASAACDIPKGYQSSLPLDDIDVFWTRLAAGLVPFYTATTVDPSVVVVSEPPARPSAYRAFKQLTDWLDADDDEVARAVGIGRTTPYAWQRHGHEPRPRTVRRLYELHAVVDAIRRALGGADLRAWMSVGSPSRRERVLATGASAIADDADTVLFGENRRPDLAWQPEPAPEGDDARAVSGAFEARSSGRRQRTASI